MKSSKTLLAAAAAGMVFSHISVAQHGDDYHPIDNVRWGSVKKPIGFEGGTTYTGRALGKVYDSMTDAHNNLAFLGAGAGNKRILDDISFVPGPWATAPTRLITRMNFGVGTLADASTFAVHFVFWPRAACNFAGATGDGTPMIDRTGFSPLAPEIVVEYTYPANNGFYETLDLTGMPGGGVSVPGDGCWIEAYITAPGSTTQSALNAAGTFIFATNTNIIGNSAVPGTTAIDYGRDFNNDGDLTGRPMAENVAGSERRFILLNNAAHVNFALALIGDFPPPPAPTAEDLGCLPDAGATRAGTLSGNISWYRVCLASPATDAAGRFLDIDTEGSDSLTDTIIAVYKSDGRIVGVDNDSGSDNNAQLSFGTGRRAAVGNGSQYDGRNYDGTDAPSLVPGLGAGVYYVAVGLNGSAFGDGFTTIPASGNGNYTINFRTNVNGTPLAPSVAPPTFDLGTLIGPTQIPSMTGSTRRVFWVQFNVCKNVTDPAEHLDINFENSDPPERVGVEALLFDSSGNLVARDMISGPGPTGQLSFGNTTPRAPAGDGVPPAGQNGDLPAGTYYLAYTYHGVHIMPMASTMGRWHVRSYIDESGYTLQGGIFPSWTDCPCHDVACVADYDDGSGSGTPDGGVTIEDLLYYLGLFEIGELCADVDDGSSTGTQDGGVTIDDLLYYLVRFANGC